MSAMNDIRVSIPENDPTRTGSLAVLAAIVVTMVIALAVQPSLPVTDAAPVVQDWKGNSGTVPDAG